MLEHHLGHEFVSAGKIDQVGGFFRKWKSIELFENPQGTVRIDLDGMASIRRDFEGSDKVFCRVFFLHLLTGDKVKLRIGLSELPDKKQIGHGLVGDDGDEVGHVYNKDLIWK